MEHLTGINDFLKQDWESSVNEIVDLKLRIEELEKEIERIHNNYEKQLYRQKNIYEDEIKELKSEMRRMERHAKNYMTTVEREMELKSVIAEKLEEEVDYYKYLTRKLRSVMRIPRLCR